MPMNFLVLKVTLYQAGKAARLVKSLLCKHENPSLDPDHLHKMSRIVHVCDPSAMTALG